MHSLPAEVPAQTLCRQIEGKGDGRWPYSNPTHFSLLARFSTTPTHLENSRAPFNRQVRGKTIKMHNNCNGEH